MAKEISSSIAVNITSKGGSKASGSIAFTEDLAGSFVGFQVTAGTTASAINLGAGVVPKVVYIQNNDSSNYVQVDNVAGMTGWPQKISAGTGVILRPQNATLYARANSDPVAIWIVAG
jgi:hypothetical protein